MFTRDNHHYQSSLNSGGDQSLSVLFDGSIVSHVLLENDFCCFDKKTNFVFFFLFHHIKQDNNAHNESTTIYHNLVDVDNSQLSHSVLSCINYYQNLSSLPNLLEDNIPTPHTTGIVTEKNLRQYTIISFLETKVISANTIVVNDGNNSWHFSHSSL